MARLIVKAFEELINEIDFTTKVKSVLPDNGLTVVAVENVFHARKLNDSLERTVNIDGTDYPIEAVDYEKNWITVVGEVVSASELTVTEPVYFYGTLLSASNEKKNKAPNDKFPAIYLNEIIDEKRYSDEFDLAQTSNLRIALLDYYSEDWTRENHYDLGITPLNNLANALEAELYRRGKAYVDKPILFRNIPKWGTYVQRGNRPQKGTEEKHFTEKLDAIEMNIELNIIRCN